MFSQRVYLIDIGGHIGKGMTGFVSIVGLQLSK